MAKKDRKDVWCEVSLTVKPTLSLTVSGPVPPEVIARGEESVADWFADRCLFEISKGIDRMLVGDVEYHEHEVDGGSVLECGKYVRRAKGWHKQDETGHLSDEAVSYGKMVEIVAPEGLPEKETPELKIVRASKKKS